MSRLLNRIHMIFEIVRACPSVFALRPWLLLGIARGHPFDGKKTWLARTMRPLYPELTLPGRWGAPWVINLDPGDISHMVIFEELVVRRTWNLDLVPFTPASILDVGAHIGMFSVLAGMRFPSANLTSIEPDEQNLKWLRRNLEANHRAAEVTAAAAHTQDGKAAFTTAVSYGGHLTSGDTAGIDGNLVTTICLRDLVKRNSEGPMLLKLDIEGGEDFVLPDVLPHLPPQCFLFLETHDGEANFAEHVQQLEASGFKVTRTRSHMPCVEAWAVR